jgi:hypothetical protein
MLRSFCLCRKNRDVANKKPDLVIRHSIFGAVNREDLQCISTDRGR